MFAALIAPRRPSAQDRGDRHPCGLFPASKFAFTGLCLLSSYDRTRFHPLQRPDLGHALPPAFSSVSTDSYVKLSSVRGWEESGHTNFSDLQKGVLSCKPILTSEIFAKVLKKSVFYAIFTIEIIRGWIYRKVHYPVNPLSLQQACFFVYLRPVPEGRQRHSAFLRRRRAGDDPCFPPLIGAVIIIWKGSLGTAEFHSSCLGRGDTLRLSPADSAPAGP